MKTGGTDGTIVNSCGPYSGRDCERCHSSPDNTKQLVTFNAQCISSDQSRTLAYNDVSGLSNRQCVADWNYLAKKHPDECRTSPCQGWPQGAGRTNEYLRECDDPSHYWDTCGCHTPGWNPLTDNYEMETIEDDPNLPDFGPSSSTTAGTTTQATTTQAMGICVNAGSMDGESCPDAAACGCTRRNLLDHEELEVDDQEEEDGMEDINSNLRKRGLQRGCKCRPNRGKFCCPNPGETCESDGVCRAPATTTLPVTTIGSTTTVPQTTSTTTQAVCTCEFGTASTESPPITTTQATTSQACVDDPDWRYTTNKGTKKTCSWVAKKTSPRCTRVGDDGRTGQEACECACA